MTRGNSLIAAFFPLVWVIGHGWAARNTREGINAKPYRILCDIYNVAANPPKTLYDLAEVEKMRDEIDVINASLADDTWFNEIASVSEKEKLSDAFKSQNGDYEGLWGRWKAAGSKVGGNHVDIKRLTEISPAVKIAQVKLKKIEGRIEKIITSLKKLNESASLDDIKNKFDAAIGEKGCVGDEAKCGVKGNRGATTCGTAVAVRGTGGSGATKSGSNLIVDFFCLCAKEYSGAGANKADGKECIDTSATAPNAKWGPSNEMEDGKKLWEALKQGCKVADRTTPAKVSEGSQALSNFLAEVGNLEHEPGDSPAAKQFGHGILGVCVSASGVCASDCDGDMSGSNKGICVAYGPKPADWEKIEWMGNMKEALRLLQLAENKTIIAQHDITQLKMFQNRAEEIYEEAKMSLEYDNNQRLKPTHNQNQSQQPNTVADKATVQDPTAVNTANVPRFILSWSLLI